MRGRYQAGVVDGRAVPGFEHASDAETFVALRAHIDNWRWAGVPFRLVTGKRLAQRTTEVVVSFKPVSHWLFDRPPHAGAVPNRLLMQLQPEENIELGLMGSLAAPEWGGTELQPLSLDLSMPATPQRRIAYERLLLDALHGNQALFVTGEEVEAAWSWIDSISEAWTPPAMRVAAPIRPAPGARPRRRTSCPSPCPRRTAGGRLHEHDASPCSPTSAAPTRASRSPTRSCAAAAA